MYPNIVIYILFKQITFNFALWRLYFIYCRFTLFFFCLLCVFLYILPLNSLYSFFCLINFADVLYYIFYFVHFLIQLQVFSVISISLLNFLFWTLAVFLLLNWFSILLKFTELFKNNYFELFVRQSIFISLGSVTGTLLCAFGDACFPEHSWSLWSRTDLCILEEVDTYLNLHRLALSGQVLWHAQCWVCQKPSEVSVCLSLPGSLGPTMASRTLGHIRSLGTLRSACCWGPFRANLAVVKARNQVYHTSLKFGAVWSYLALKQL